jgi:hypothetical protein
MQPIARASCSHVLEYGHVVVVQWCITVRIHMYVHNCHLGWRTLILKCNQNNYD